MREHGLVIDINGYTAQVLLDRSLNSSDCNIYYAGKCETMIVEAENTANAERGDHVIVEVEDRQAVKAAFLAFGLPTAALSVGTLIHASIAESIGLNGSSSIIGFIGGLALMVVAFVGVHRYDRHLRRKKCNDLKITQIVRDRLQGVMLKEAF